MVQVLNVYFPWGLPNYFAKPKSEIFIYPFRPMNMFSGFRSYMIVKILLDGKYSFYEEKPIPAIFRSKSSFYRNRSWLSMEQLTNQSVTDRNQVLHKHRDDWIDFGLLLKFLHGWFHNILQYFCGLMSLKD